MDRKYISSLGIRHQIIRMLWIICWGMLASWIPRSLASGWKRFLLRLFGARIAPNAIVYSTAKIYYPANLTMDEYACVASNVDCYNVAHIHIGKFATVSQGAMLCTASHDITSPTHDLITSPITIGPQSWVGAGVFIKTGVQFKKVCGWARVAVFNNVYPLYVQ